MTIINRDTFEPTGKPETKSFGAVWTDGTIEATLHGLTKRIVVYRAVNLSDNSVEYTSHYAFTGRYETGKKAWPATVISKPNGGEWIRFGRDDRSGKFNKANYLFWRKDA